MGRVRIATVVFFTLAACEGTELAARTPLRGQTAVPGQSLLQGQGQSLMQGRDALLGQSVRRTQDGIQTRSTVVTGVDVPKIAGAPDLGQVARALTLGFAGSSDHGPETAMGGPTPTGHALPGFASVSGFIQRLPVDGRPAIHETTVYLGYDRQALHVVFAAADATPSAIRARMAPRENIGGDDFVTLMLDTDADGRRAYAFRSNPRGIQWDALFTEGQGFDVSFDAVWESEGRVTDWGYLVRMEIPFKSLRFEPGDVQRWGVVLSRQLARDSREDTTWPRVSSAVEGTLTQSAPLTGLRNISPGRNLQAIPYTTYRAFRALDRRAPEGPRFVTDAADVSVGGDFKAVIRDRFVLDLTANPDFSQVESDQPQITVNQRFEVFFPERRPFFTENADYFRTPLNLFFSRRILDPQMGVRFTGKAGGWGIGTLVIDDQAPGKLASPGSGLEGSRAWTASARVTRDVFGHSTIGAMYAGRELDSTYNRTAGLDGRFRLNSHWTLSGQVATSSTADSQGTVTTAPAYTASVSRSDRRLFFFTGFTDVHPDFETRLGFVPRVDIRRLSHFSSFFWRPEDGVLTSWGPELFARAVWDHDGQLLDELLEGSLEWNFVSNTGFEANVRKATERLRPQDHTSLETTRAYDMSLVDLEFRTSLLHWLTVNGNFGWGHQTNFSPAEGAEPETGDWMRLNGTVSFRPATQLRIDNTVIWSRLDDPLTGGRIFNDWILRTRWNWQWSRELSVRAILQYEDRATDSQLTSLLARRNVNADLLLTYRLNPWTAVYAGVNGNAQNIALVEAPDRERELRRTNGLHNDARQFFLKVSYLVRF